MNNNKLNAWLLNRNRNRSKTAIFVFGRMNPPTKGHEQLIKQVRNVANRLGITAYVFVSRSKNNVDNPLSVDAKLYLLRKMFPNMGNRILNNKNPIIAGQTLKNDGRLHVILVAGSNRAQSYGKMAGGKTKAGVPYPVNKFHPYSGKSRITAKTFNKFEALSNNEKTAAYSGTLARSIMRNKINNNTKISRLQQVLSNKLTRNNIQQKVLTRNT
jgi:hypothetical protein